MMFLCLKPDGEVREVKRSLNPKFVVGDATLSLQYLKGVIEVKGRGKVEQLCMWEFMGNTVHMYGWKNGSPDTQTAHSLPKPLDKERIYGDVLCFRTEGIQNEIETDSVLLDMTENMYLDFYQSFAFEEAEYDVEEGEDIEEEGEEDIENDGSEVEIEVEDEEEERIIQAIVKKSRRTSSKSSASVSKLYNFQFMDLRDADNELEIEAEYTGGVECVAQ